ncbi:MAG: hypothetical protein EON93_20995 [Burkholderiales bacterium]|nr:MAG: hypothetical protein EON93_20995 [Burkholderiales bacterium]
MIDDARAIFQSDIMKSCHHGAADVTDAFLEAVNPAAFVISSGDAEGHVHPRPDLLGRLGALGRGSAPVILATELQRSTRERESQDVIDRVTANVEKLAAQPSAALLAKVKQDLQSLSGRNVEVYGAIYVKTDGEQLIAAFKIEEQSPTDKWFYFQYVFDENGELMRTD